MTIHPEITVGIEDTNLTPGLRIIKILGVMHTDNTTIAITSSNPTPHVTTTGRKTSIKTIEDP